jgi:YHS domain-containing protein
MFRAILELLLSLVVIAIARVVLMGLMKGISSASSQAFQNPSPQQPGQRSGASETPAAGLLHKDPVCGTFVAESTHFRRQSGRQTFFYCSEACQQKHAAAAR